MLTFRLSRLRVSVSRRPNRLTGISVTLRNGLAADRYPRTSPGSIGRLIRLQLEEGVRVPFELLDTESLSEFTLDVYRTLCRTRSGDRITYGKLAEDSGHPGAARAVGQCLKRNPFPLLIPCHRVVKKSGEPGGYGGNSSSELKRYLLFGESGGRSFTIF